MDILSRIDLALARQRHGELHRFTVVNVPGIVYERILRRYRIHCYGRSITERDGSQWRSFYVPKRQARWAEYLLLRAGIPLACTLIDDRNLAAAEHNDMPRQWQSGSERKGLIEWLGDAMAALAGTQRKG